MSRALTGPSGQTYFHNGDFSGGFDVYLEPKEGDPATGKIQVNIPKEDAIAMAAEMIRSEVIEFAETASHAQLLAMLGTLLPED